MPRFSIRHHIKAKHIYVCRGCGLQHQIKIAQCSCGRMDFDHFPSLAEADRWAQLLLLEKIGKIMELRRQVRFPLMAIGPNGPVTVATYVADFTYKRDGVLVIEDVKGKRKMDFVVDRLAELKLKWMAAQGTPVSTISL